MSGQASLEDTFLRFLQTSESSAATSHHRGRTVLTVLYLCVLGLCFVVPVFYYFRMHCEERNARRMREIEIAGITQALEQSENVHREESRAARRKYREERRARIIQLFATVRMILKEENFPHLKEAKGDTLAPISATPVVEPVENVTEDLAQKEEVDTDAKDDNETKSGEIMSVNAQPLGDTGEHTAPIPPPPDEIDYDNTFIELPEPGFCTNEKTRQLRLVPNMCSICLCNYEVGNDIVWSSNEACDHVFHKLCIEQWIMKQREGPLCPCCRRDFVLDPYDLEEEEEWDPDAVLINAMESGELSPAQVPLQALFHDPHLDEMEQIPDESNVMDEEAGMPQEAEAPLSDTPISPPEDREEENEQQNQSNP